MILDMSAIIMYVFNLPILVSQFAPVYFDLQVHSYSASRSSTQVPSLHGLLSHSSGRQNFFFHLYLAGGYYLMFMYTKKLWFGCSESF